jgi:mRNA interferase MazF
LATSIERGEVYWVNFEPSQGGEIKKTRPAIVLSNNAANTYLNSVQVVPLTSKTERLYPGEALVSLNIGDTYNGKRLDRTEKRKAMADQLTTVSKQRLCGRIGMLGKEDLEKVEAAVLLQLGMDRS